MGLITNPIDRAREAAADFEKCYGSDLVSVIVYGSASGGDFDPKKSDINLLVVLSSMAPALLEKSKTIQDKWIKNRFSRPLFMDRAYINSSLDSFPIEFFGMKENGHVIFGEDILKGLAIDSHDLRLQIERELKGKWLRLSQEWLALLGNKNMLVRLLHLSAKDFSAVFRAMLYLKNQEVPRNRKSLFAAVSRAYGLDEKPLEKVVEALASDNKKEIPAIFPDYLNAIKTIINAVDQLSIKETV